MSSKSARRRARELALQGVYQWLLSGSGITQIEDQTTQLTGFDKADAALFKTLLRGTIGAANTLEGHFSPYLDRSVAELSPIERSVLLLGTYELADQIEVPYKVVINEAIELTKACSTRSPGSCGPPKSQRARRAEKNQPRVTEGRHAFAVLNPRAGLTAGLRVQPSSSFRARSPSMKSPGVGSGVLGTAMSSGLICSVKPSSDAIMLTSRRATGLLNR